MGVKSQIEKLSSQLTATERRLSAAILTDYPFAGLLPISELAANTQTSSPTVSRFVTKLGFAGFQEFQRQLIVELKEGQRSPVDLKSTSAPVEGAYLGGFLDRVESLVVETKSSVSEAQFQRICRLITDPSRRIFLIGGRMSDMLAQYTYRHLRQIRSKVYHIPSDPQEWPEHISTMQPRDILIILDFRRYQETLARLAKVVRSERNGQVVLVTDQWISPVAKWSREVLALPIDSGTLWDSYAAAFAVMESILTNIAELNWERTKTRIQSWDAYRKEIEDNHDET